MNNLLSQKFLKEFNSILDSKNNAHLESSLKIEVKGDEAEIVNIESLNHLNMRLNSRNLLFMKKVEKAKEKILNGTYGLCEECGEEIEQKRLAARPMTDLCIGCKEEKEKGENLNINHRRDLQNIG